MKQPCRPTWESKRRPTRNVSTQAVYHISQKIARANGKEYQKQEPSASLVTVFDRTCKNISSSLAGITLIRSARRRWNRASSRGRQRHSARGYETARWHKQMGRCVKEGSAKTESRRKMVVRRCKTVRRRRTVRRHERYKTVKRRTKKARTGDVLAFLKCSQKTEQRKKRRKFKE